MTRRSPFRRHPFARAGLLAGALACLLAVPELRAQQRLDVCGTAVGQLPAAMQAKGNAVHVERTVLLEEVAFYLDFTDVQTLEFTIHRAVGEDGDYELCRRFLVPTVGRGADWYSSGTTLEPLLAGNHYLLCVAWSGTVTYGYTVAESWPLSYGEQVHGYWTGNYPLPERVRSTPDMPAAYFMATWTRDPAPNEPTVTSLGGGCALSGEPEPVLVATQMPLIGNRNFALEVGAAPGRPVWLAVSAASVRPPVVLPGGCAFHLDPLAALIWIGPIATDAHGVARFPVAIPYDPLFRGVVVPLQASVWNLGTARADFSDAIELYYW